MEIRFWADYACPYSYIGITNLFAAVDELDLKNVKLSMKAYELFPDVTEASYPEGVDFFQAKMKSDRPAAEAKVENIISRARDAGLDFNLRHYQKTNTRNAHRLTKLAASLGLERQIIPIVYYYYFDLEKDVNDPAVLREIATKAGISKTDLDRFLSNKAEFLDDVLADEAEARTLDIHSVPHFVINSDDVVADAITKQKWIEILSPEQ